MATASTVRAALDVVEASDTSASLAELPGLLLPALARLAGAESAMWAELSGIRPPRYVGYPEPLVTAEAIQAIERHAPASPLIRHTRPGGDGRPMRRSDLQSTRSYFNSGIYCDVARALGADHVLAAALAPASPGSPHVCVSLSRARRDFPEAAVDVLTWLQPLLTRRVARLAAEDALPSAGPELPPLTTRQEQVLRLVADGLTDAAIGRHLGCSPRTVDKHLEHIYRRLGVSSRITAVAAARATLGFRQRAGGAAGF